MAKGPLEFSLQNTQTKFTFEDFEIPSHIDSLGSDQITKLHQFPGGRRILQTFGNVPREEITWSGIIFGPDSFARFNQLNTMTQFNGYTTLTYGPFIFKGVFKSCKGTPGFEGYIPYSAVFVPAQDLSLFAVPLVPPQTQNTAVDVGVQACVAASSAAFAGSDTFAVQSFATQLDDACSTVTPTNYAASVTPFSAVSSAMFAFLSTAVDMDDAVLVLPMYVSAQATLTALGTITSPQVTFLTADNPNLFRLAARYYGDASQWTLIAAANGGLPPFNYGTFSLVVPLSA